MLAQLETVVLIKEALKLSFFYSIWSISICGFDYRRKMARNKEPSSETHQSILDVFLLLQDISKKLKTLLKTMLCTTPFTEQRKLALNRIERGVGGPGA